MPLNEIPKFFSAETRSLIDSALEQAWQELKKDGSTLKPVGAIDPSCIAHAPSPQMAPTPLVGASFYCLSG